ncbi:MAG: site-specific integrase [Actinobacteria bacterium]|nr:site-specific integrase [Actinomycetota bacterium]
MIEPKDGRAWAIRFRAGGRRRYVTLGTSEEGWSRQKAEAELRHVLADVERGVWQPYEPPPAEVPAEVPTFHRFSTDWLRAREGELRPRTVHDYEWCLSNHLLPYFRLHRLDEIDVAAVDAYKASKVKEGRIAGAQINKTLKALAMILDAAIEYGVIDKANPARGRRRRVKADPPARTWVEPEQLIALLEAAPKGHRIIVATLAGAGLRVGEACALRWRDLDLSTSTLTVRASKTNTGRREVDLPRALVDELWTLAASSPLTEPDDPVFIGTHRTPQTPANVSRRLKTAIKRANPKLEGLGIAPISERVTPHSLRRTYASLRYACGDDVVYVAEQGGWSDPSFPIRVYARSVRRRQKLSGDHLEAFDSAIHWAALGSEVASRSQESPEGVAERAQEPAA